MQQYSEYDSRYAKSQRHHMVLQTAAVVIMIGLGLGLSMDYLTADAAADTQPGFKLINVAHATR